MDNLRLEHPGPFSTHAQAGTHHLLNFSPSIEFSSQLNKPNNNAHLHTHPLSSPWASLWADPQYSQNSPLLKNGLQSPEHGSSARAWNASVDSILQLKHGNTINMTEFSHPDAPMDALREESPTLQLKHGSTILSAEFGPHLVTPADVLRGDNSHLSAPMNALRGNNTHLSVTANAFGKDNTHLSNVLVAAPLCMDRGSTSPVSVVSGSQPIPLVHKPDGITGQILGFASLSQDDSEKASSKGRDGVGIVKAEVMGESSVGMKGSDRGGCNQHGYGSDGKGVIVKKEQGGVTIASLEDGSIGLKLGKRTYYAGGDEACRRANSSSTCNGSGKNNSSSNNISSGNTTTTTTNNNNNNNNNNNSSSNNNNNKNNNSANKKQKGSSVSSVVPACQAEGCPADLSGAKDYHRRHKVCELHSKASKAKVNNLEQRFCQQCSRFHVLSAFDEGKRSCRRRLAGHNERRRKPPPEPMPFLSPGGFAYFPDSRANASLHDHPYYLQHRRSSMVPTSIDNAVLACHLGLAGFPQQETMGNYHALELHHFMQGLPPGGGSGVGLVDGGGALMLANGNGLALSNASSLTTPPSSSPVGLIPHVSSEMAISGRALSLLSSSFGSPETMSISLGMTSPSIDQFLSETHALAPSRQVAPNSTSCFISGIGMTSAQHGIGHNHNHALNSLTSSSSGCSTEIDQGEPPTMSSFEGRSLFLMHSENGFQNLQDGGNSHHGRPMLDLMQISPGESHHGQQSQAELSYADLQGLSIFGRSTIM